MTHDPEAMAAAYLEDMTERSRTTYEAHLLDCDACWREVRLAREGRELAEGARELAPSGIREDIRATTTAAATGAPKGHRYPVRALVITAVAVLALAGAAITRQPWQHPSTPAAPATTPGAPVAAAVAGFRDNQLPGTTVPDKTAPDLSSIGLHLVAAGGGDMAGAAVYVFAYRDSAGTRLSVYQSSRPIPEAVEAQHLGDDDDAWTLQSDGVSVLCAKGNHSLLLLSSDATLMRQAGAVLNAI